MRNRILGAVGVLWGGAVLVNGLLRGGAGEGGGAYAAGRSAGLVFGLALFGGLVIGHIVGKLLARLCAPGALADGTAERASAAPVGGVPAVSDRLASTSCQ